MPMKALKTITEKGKWIMQTDIEKQALDKMIKARTHLLFDNPFIGANAIRYKLIPGDKTPCGKQINTAAINGKEIYFNPIYINQLSFNQVKFLLAHESFHCMLGHHIRRSGRDFEVWNKAGDYVINDLLIDEQIGEQIDGILFDPLYTGLSTEQVFKSLFQEKQETEKNTQKNNGKSEQIANNSAGSVIDAPKDLTQAEIESELKESIQSAMNYAKKAGKMPGAKIQKILSAILAPKANWKSLLKQWIDSTDKSDVSFSRPIDRGHGYYSPGYYSEGLNQLVIALDVSRSVLSHPQAISSFQSEINELKNVFQFDCTLIYFHSHIEKIESYQRHEKITIKIEETGGTRIKPVFDHIQDNGLNNQIAGLIVFTDLEIFDFPAHEPSFKTLFVKYGKSTFCEESPIGDTIDIE